MKENVGRIDRMLRFVAGPALTAFGYARLGGRKGEWPGLAAMLVGALIVESAVTRVCPMSALLHIDTRSERERTRDLRALLEKQADLGFAGAA
jgi:hypothetical protein